MPAHFASSSLAAPIDVCFSHEGDCMADDEVVWCVPAAAVPLSLGRCPLNHYSPEVNNALPDLLEFKRLVPRSKCEADESLLQIIPYVAVVCGDYVMVYTRGTAGEPRLNAKQSIGFGGHLNDGDKSYLDGLCREGREELIGFLPGATTAPIGFIYDDSTPVNRVHLGVLHVYAFTDCPVVPAEVHLHRWARIEHIIPSETVETWSRIAAIMLMECSLDDQDDNRQATRFPDEAAVAPDC